MSRSRVRTKNNYTCGHMGAFHAAHGLCTKCYAKAKYRKDPGPKRRNATSWYQRNKKDVAAKKREQRAADNQRHRDRQREYYSKNREKLTQYAKEQRRKHPLRWRNWQMGAYGLTLNDYQEMLKHQGGKCAVCRNACKSGRALALDHDHATGAVRSLLCAKCNNGLGYFNDDLELLGRAIAYLATHKRGGKWDLMAANAGADSGTKFTQHTSEHKKSGDRADSDRLQ